MKTFFYFIFSSLLPQFSNSDYRKPKDKKTSGLKRQKQGKLDPVTALKLRSDIGNDNDF